ncbi:MAG: sugar-binding domain-containing protein, partial [Promethearchaeota archaeon]
MQKKILKTLWTDKVLEASSINSSLPLPDYPRPQMRRPKWFNLNGKWQYYITRKKDLRNLGGLNIMFDNYKKRGRLNKLIGTEFKVLDKLLDLDSPGSPETKENNEKDGDADGKSMNYCESSGEILVPFCIESYLSGVQRALKPNEILWYKRKVGVPKEWLYDEQGKHNSDRLLIHFGAVDFEARIFINKHYVGGHRGGYTPFTIDITDFIRKEVPNSDHAGDFEIIVGVWDPTDKGRQERGKQVLKPWMIFYTAVSGIWQTVWLEPVPQTYIEDIKITPLLDEKSLLIEPKISSSSGLGG